MSDSAGAYEELVHPGIVEKHHVIHCLKELIHPCMITFNVTIGEKVPSRVLAQTVDHNWKIVEGEVAPQHLGENRRREGCVGRVDSCSLVADAAIHGRFVEGILQHCKAVRGTDASSAGVSSKPSSKATWMLWAIMSSKAWRP